MIQEFLFSRPSRGACTVTLLLAAAVSPMIAEAATGTATGPATTPAAAGSPEATYQRERADCLAGRTQEGQKTCLYEASSARDAARKGLLTTATPKVLHDNLQQRCLVQPKGPERAACDRMAQGAGTVTGSVATGGQLRELTTLVPTGRKQGRAKRAAVSVQ